jgi:uroporphyrinogen decarboxylase
MSALKNDRFLRAAFREPVDMTPIWIMRQAGRYLPEYRATRARAGSFMKLCQTPELACEVTLQPLNRFALDASIIFSDILTIPDAMGLGLHFVEGEGPQFHHPVQTEADIAKLSVPDPQKLAYVYDAIKLVTHELDRRIPLIGFCGSPWTLAAYMVEGRSKTGFKKLLAMRQENPALLHQLLNTLALSVGDHLNHQIEAGANAVMLFDTCGGMLSTEDYLEFSLRYLQQIVAMLKRVYQDRKIPVILFTKGGGQWLEAMIKTGCDTIGVDWEISLQEARAKVGNQVSLQGNLRPEVLLSTPDMIQAETKNILSAYGYGSGHIFNLGHGITPDVPPEHVAILVEAVHEFSKAYHEER